MHDTTPRQTTSDIRGLIHRCDILWTELERFREYLKQQKLEHSLELSHYRGVVQSERNHLRRLAEKEREAHDSNSDSDEDTVAVPSHYAASSNLPFIEAVWSATKATTGLQALQKRFYYGEIVENHRTTCGQRTRKGRGARNTIVRKSKALVDVVAHEGREWIKVSLVTNHRMLMDKAREGWAGSSDEGSDEEPDSDDLDSGIPLVRMTEALAEAAKTVKIRASHPRVRLLLPKIVEGQQPEVDKILARFRSLGVVVECDPACIAPQPIDKVMSRMLTNPFAGLTDSLNIDCTILLALVSDFSHRAVSAESWFNRALKKQLDIEDNENLLPNTLYPAVAGRHLVCTKDAALRMQEIVETIGTEGEKLRTMLFMNDDSRDGDQLRDELQRWSRFEVPPNLELPIRIVESSRSGLPSVSQKVEQHLTSINQSVFLHGWSSNMSTVTSNRTVVKVIENVLDQHALTEEEWPRIWLCPVARSLVGKEKGRRDEIVQK